MSFKRITRLYREESSKKALTPLEPDFFEKFSSYLEDLETSAKKMAANEKPEAAASLLDEHKKASKKRDQVFRLRLRKIANLAASKIGGASVDLEPLTKHEQAMFEGLVNMLADAKAQIYSAQKVQSPAKREEVTAPKSSEHMVLRILEDVPSFAGVAGNYKLKKEDIASLPRKVAEILVKKGKAQEIQVQ